MPPVDHHTEQLGANNDYNLGCILFLYQRESGIWQQFFT